MNKDFSSYETTGNCYTLPAQKEESFILSTPFSQQRTPPLLSFTLLCHPWDFHFTAVSTGTDKETTHVDPDKVLGEISLL